MGMREMQERRNRTMDQVVRGKSTVTPEVIYLRGRRAPEREVACKGCGNPLKVNGSVSIDPICQACNDRS